MSDEENDPPQQTPEAGQASDDPAHDRIAAIIKAVSELVTQPPTLLGFDFADLRQGLVDEGLAPFGEGEATGENRATHAADLAIDDIRRQLRMATAHDHEQANRETDDASD